MLYSRSNSQWRLEGICIDEGSWRGIGIACQWDYIKHVYFPDNLVAVAHCNENHYFQRLLAYWDMLGRFNHGI